MEQEKLIEALEDLACAATAYLPNSTEIDATPDPRAWNNLSRAIADADKVLRIVEDEAEQSRPNRCQVVINGKELDRYE